MRKLFWNDKGLRRSPRGFIILFAIISPRRSRGDIILIITYRAGYKIILTEQALKSILVALVVSGM